MFKEQLAKKVVAGTKTQTRRRLNREKQRSPWWVWECSYRKGQVFAVNPGRGVPSIGKAILTEKPRKERLGDITEADARAEGFGSRSHFFMAWGSINKKIDHDEIVWVLTFRPAEAS